MFKQPLKKENGFAILFAILLATLVLSIGMSILNISIKELIISGFSNESAQATYAAQTAVECALYWEKKGMILGPLSKANFSNMSCGWQIAPTDQNTRTTANPVYDRGKDTTPAKAFFWFYLSDTAEAGPCARVEVENTYNTTMFFVTQAIRTRGYNICDETSGRRVEKSFEMSN